MDTTAAASPLGARERILAAAYHLFSRRGLRAVGVDEVIAQAGVAKATFYRYFPAKDDLALEFLHRREVAWTLDFVMAESARRGATPEQRLLAIFDGFHDWFQQADFEGCSFINVLLEMGPGHPAGRASIQYLENIRAGVRDRAEEAGLVQVDDFARAWHILMKGSIISAAEGDTGAARRAQAMACDLIGRHRPA
jgi:AcrR family transcriptional regulator